MMPAEQVRRKRAHEAGLDAMAAGGLDVARYYLI